MVEFQDRAIESIVEGVLHLCRIDDVFDVRENLVGASHVDDNLGIVSSSTLVALLGTDSCAGTFWFRFFSSNNSVSIHSHEYSAHFVSRDGVIELG